MNQLNIKQGEYLLLINQTLAGLGENEIVFGRYSGKEFWTGSQIITRYVRDYKRLNEIFTNSFNSTQVLPKDHILCSGIR